MPQPVEYILSNFGELAMESSSIYPFHQIKEFDKPNQHKPGTRLLVRAFDYGNGFEIVPEAERLEDFTYYEVEIKSIVIPMPSNFGTFVSASQVSGI